MSRAMPLTKRVRHRSAESQAEFKQQLLAHARQLYLEKGFDGMSIRALTEAFSMSPMSFYGYFDSKLDLARHIWIDFFRELLDVLLAAAHGKRSPVQVLTAHVGAYIDYWESHPDRYRMVYMTDLGHGSEASAEQITDDPVYRQLAVLARERVLACACGRPVPERTIRRLCDMMFAKAVGYLHTSVGLKRYPLGDRDDLKKAMVRDIVHSVTQGTEG